MNDDFYVSNCQVCRHLTGLMRCAAFPGGIPAPIWYQQADHRLPYDGDGGIRFEHEDVQLRELYSLEAQKVGTQTRLSVRLRCQRLNIANELFSIKMEL